MITTAETVKKIYEGGKRPFLVSSHQERRYNELATRISSWLTAYDNAGVSSQDRVLIVTSDGPASVEAFLAAMLDGKVPAIVSPATSNERLARLVAHFEPALIVAASESNWTKTAPLLDIGQVGTGRRTLFGKRVEGRRPSADSLDEDTAYVMFTSGSTSEPKGVVISHGALAAQLNELVSLFGYDQNARIFNGMMLSHADGLIQGPVLAAATGATWLRPPDFVASEIEDWLNLVSALNATHFLTVPTVYAMIDRMASHDDYFDLPDLELLQSVGAKLPDPLRSRIEDRFGKKMANHYGLTETVVTALYNVPGHSCSGIGDVGCGLGVKARLLDIAGNEAAEGELLLKGNQLFDGYWHASQLTEAVLKDGWLRTGDLARREMDGSISIIGRIKTAINTGGLLVQPDEIDEALTSHPDVAEAATVGMQDDIFGEIVVSAVVLTEPVEEAALTEHCRAKLEPLKVPKRIVAVESIPRGDAGKPQIAQLRSLLSDRLTDLACELGEEDTMSQVIEIAASVFRLRPEELSAESTPDMVAGWDSFTHLSLIMEAERRFGCRLETSAIARIRSLRDLASVVA